jgi:hypothetical protein
MTPLSGVAQFRDRDRVTACIRDSKNLKAAAGGVTEKDRVALP